MASSEEEISQIEAEVYIHPHMASDGSGDTPKETDSNTDKEKELKLKRKLIRSRLTRAINRVKDCIKEGNLTERRTERIKIDLRKDMDAALEVHAKLYDVSEPNMVHLDKWEGDITNDIYSIEEMIEDYLTAKRHDMSMKVAHNTRSSKKTCSIEVERDLDSDMDSASASDNKCENPNSELTSKLNSLSLDTCGSVDSWIDCLVEFKETEHPQINTSKDISLADALLRIESRKDIPNIELRKFDGNPLQYVEFVESFKVHIHDKQNISDNLRMAQLKTLLTGRAEIAVSGLGSSGIMYATTLKTLKDQFGQRSVITRAFVNKITKGEVIRGNDKEALRILAIDVVNCLATLKRLDHMADINASESLRMVISRLPDDMISRWKGVASGIRERGERPTIEHISEFLRKRVRADFDPDFGDIERSARNKDPQRLSQGRRGIHSAQMQRTAKCYMCSSPHMISACPKFKECTVSQKTDFVKENRLCYSCLLRGHRTADCRSRKACNVDGCKRTHHPLLHTVPKSAGGAQSVIDRASILPVIRVKFRAPNGRIRDGNVLIDSGAGATVIRSEFAKILGLQGRREGLNLLVVGGDSHRERDSRRVKFWISPIDGGEEFQIEANEIDKTVHDVSHLDMKWLKSFKHLEGIPIAQRYGRVDLILGVQYSHIHADQDIREGLPFEPVGKKTRLGWTVLGADHQELGSQVSVGFCQRVDLERMYDLETLGVKASNCGCPRISQRDREVLEMFEKSCELIDGRYQIGLPWSKNPELLPNNYTLAEKRLASLERSLSKNPGKAEMYRKVMMEYETNGWSQRVESPSDQGYYLPHHGVVRLNKQSTPLRVVFDPACTFNGSSLNSFLYKGPSTLGDLFGILIRFREERVAFVGDISKMFLQICLPEKDTQFHRYLWRDLDETKKPRIYRLLRVTFGDKSSPEMANFVMRKIAETNKDQFPGAAEILIRDRYMDDLIHSCEDKWCSEHLRKDLDTILGTGSFKVKKWHVSGETLEEKQDMTDITGDRENKVKTLGISWNCEMDSLHFTVKHCTEESYTKRSVLSKIATVFDPLGLASVVTIRAKVAMQEIWKIRELDWDDKLPVDMCQIWSGIFDDLERLNEIQIPRCLKPAESTGSSELHVFADASMTAYGACAYLLWPTSHGPSVSLVAAKARVAPLRQITIPRLELMAGLIASRLARTLYAELRDKPDVYLWSDSQVLLKWLQSESSSKKAFVAVRIAEIQNEWDVKRWQYVPTESNPADDLSRGIEVSEMPLRWLSGPEFLRKPKDQWPAQQWMHNSGEEETTSEDKRMWPRCLGMQKANVERGQIFGSERYSSWKRLLRITAYCLRFIESLKKKVDGQPTREMCKEVLRPAEIATAERYWVQVAQSEIRNVEQTCADLAPFDDNGIIRVGGRLRHTTLSYDERHPILLPSSSHVTRLIIQEMHEKVFHAGSERTLSESRRKFWILKGRNVTKNVVNKCIMCRKLRQPSHTTLMADLPPERLRAFSPPFTTTGVDLFGPFNLKYGRNKKIKAWGALFTCATVRAVHLEIVENLSTQAFLHALRRFVSHHGWPSIILSDNGKSFVGAEKELRKLLVECRSDIENFSSVHSLKWKFSTPLSPHQGGIYESLIKQAKRAMKVAIGDQTLNWNEMSTVFAEVKSLLNSRPLTMSPNNPNDMQPITPNHFLMGRASHDAPQGPFGQTTNLNKRFEYIQELTQQIWKRFVREYFPTLMKRTKWLSRGRQLQIGDIVLLVDHNSKRGDWKLARIVDVFPGKDGIVRNVEVKTQHGHYKRAVQQCCLIIENVLS